MMENRYTTGKKMSRRFKKVVKETVLVGAGLMMVFSAYALAAYNDQELYNEPSVEFSSR